MIFFQKEDFSGLWNCIADGYVYGKYKTEKKKGIVVTVFSICYNILFDKIKGKKYYIANAIVYGEENSRFILNSKRNRSRIVVLGNSTLLQGTAEDSPKYMIRVTALLPVGDIISLINYYNGSMRYDKNIINAYEMRYDYETPENEAEHMI
jgi:hypothetical protein